MVVSVDDGGLGAIRVRGQPSHPFVLLAWASGRGR